MALTFYIIICILILHKSTDSNGKKTPDGKKAKAEKIGKSIADMSEADMYKLLDQWDENDDDHDATDYDDDDPRREQAKKTPLKFDPNMMQEDPMAMLKMSKKGQTLMMFATVAGNPTRKDSERITALWQGSLQNANLQLQRYLIADNRVLFQLTDGSKAWEIKDYLITLKDCEEVTIENQKFPGAGAKIKTEL